MDEYNVQDVMETENEKITRIVGEVLYSKRILLQTENVEEGGIITINAPDVYYHKKLLLECITALKSNITKSSNVDNFTIILKTGDAIISSSVVDGGGDGFSLTNPKVDKFEERSNILLKYINQIDDYFEYRNESPKDKKFVIDCLDELSKELGKS